MNKVYCKNCKYACNGILSERCKIPLKTRNIDSNEFTGKKQSECTVPAFKMESNEKGDCPRYKQKWHRKLLRLDK